MRRLRRIVAMLILPLALLVPTIIGTLAALLLTPPGHAMLSRIATRWISGALAGTIEIGAISGNIWEHIVLDRVVLRDEHGNVVLSTPRLEASYLLPELFARRLVFHGVQADSLVLHLVRLRAGQWNYERVFHMGETTGSGAPPPLVELLHLQLTDASLQIDVPTTPGAPRQPASRNARAPFQPRIDTTADGPVRVYTASNLNLTLARLRVTTPRHDPLLADITALAAKLGDPQLTITQMAGRIVAANDTLRFQFDSAGLPSSRLKGRGAVRWPHDTLLFDFAFDAPQVALRDLWWIQPDLPDWQGKGRITAKSLSGSRTDFKLENLALGTGVTSVAGNVTLVTDNTHGLGMRAGDLQLRNTPIAVLRPYLDTLPVAGGLTGHLTMDGFLDSLKLGGDVVFVDALVPGGAASRLRIDGVAHLGGAEGAVFERFRLDRSSIALGTIQRLVPSVAIPGELRLSGELDGPWKNMHFTGTVEHAAPDSALSRMVGNVRLDTRGAVLGLAIDANLDQLSFDALRTGYPSLTPRGGLTGHLIAKGNLDSLDIDTQLSGEIGNLSAVGRVRLNSPHFGADSLILDLQRLDAEAVLGHGSSTALNGRVTVRGSIDSGVPPRGTLTLALDRSRIGGATVDAITGVVHADHGMLMVDTGTVIWGAGRVDARGTLGWAAPDSGTLTVLASASSLAPFDSMLRVVTGKTADTLQPHAFEGQAEASLVLTGSLDAVSVNGTVNGSQIVLDGWRANRIAATLHADSLGQRGLSIEATVDTVGLDSHVADRLHLLASGKPDSLRFAGDIAMLAFRGSAGGTWRTDANRSSVQLDTLSLAFPHQRWRLAAPTRVILTGNQLSLSDTLRLLSADGSGAVQVSGTMPGDTPGKLDASVTGLDLLDVFGVLQRDTTALDGWGSLDLHLAGTREAPTIKGDVSIISPVLGDLHAPSIQATFDYASLRLRSSVALWKTGQKVLDGTVSLPLDLALTGRSVRKLDGPLQISAVADSVDLVILAALIPSIQNPTGLFSLNVKGNGTWNAPGLQGQVAIYNGAMSLPSLSVSYGSINGVAHFSADSLAIDSLLIANGDGRLSARGGLRFARLAQPTLDLRLSAQDFLAINQQNVLVAHVTGDVRLTGPVLQPVLSGSDLLLSRSVIYFGDLIAKNVIDLDDPANASLIDLTALQREQLRSEFTNRFLDSLRIGNLNVRIGSEVWLRSGEANIQLEGNLQVDKNRKVYNLTGDLDTPRGTYTLRIGPINSDFIIDQGSVRYFGAADLNAILDIQAHHQVRTLEGDDFNVVAAITGTIKEPKVDLSAPGRSLSDRDLASYVLFGQSEFQLTGGSQGTSGATSAALIALTTAFTSEVQRSLVRGGGPFSSFTIRPGITPTTVTSSAAATQFAAGLQFGRSWFVTFDAGLCASQGSVLQKRNFGASLEYRMSREFRLQAAAEPVQTCAANRAADVFTTLSRYQLGGNLLWQRDY